MLGLCWYSFPPSSSSPSFLPSSHNTSFTPTPLTTFHLFVEVKKFTVNSAPSTCSLLVLSASCQPAAKSSFLPAHLQRFLLFLLPDFFPRTFKQLSCKISHFPLSSWRPPSDPPRTSPPSLVMLPTKSPCCLSAARCLAGNLSLKRPVSIPSKDCPEPQVSNKASERGQKSLPRFHCQQHPNQLHQARHSRSFCHPSQYPPR